MTPQKNITRIVGVTTCLIGAALMAFGKPIMGLENTGIATAVVITGICLINVGNKTSINRKKEAM